jgi:hypothetical protein
MTARLRLILVGVLMTGLVLGAACRRKAAYSDIDANRSSDSKPVEQTLPETNPAPGADPQASSNSTVAASQPNAGARIPWFVDTVNGQVKDLPNYPNALRRNVSYGPMSGQDTMSLVLETHDPMEKIAQFYDRVTKDNKWKVTDRTVDPDLSEWILKKGDNGDAKVQVQKDPRQPGVLYIVIARVERPAQTETPSK